MILLTTLHTPRRLPAALCIMLLAGCSPSTPSTALSACQTALRERNPSATLTDFADESGSRTVEILQGTRYRVVSDVTVDRVRTRFSCTVDRDASGHWTIFSFESEPR